MRIGTELCKKYPCDMCTDLKKFRRIKRGIVPKSCLQLYQVYFEEGKGCMVDTFDDDKGYYKQSKYLLYIRV